MRRTLQMPLEIPSKARAVFGTVGSADTELSLQRPSRAQRCPTCEQIFSGEALFCPFDGDPLVDAPDWDPLADPLLGRRIEGRYDVLGVIGEGGMGTVYEVRHVVLGRLFALKVLRRDVADAELIARFVQEAKAAAAIGHPGIVAVSDFGELPEGSGSVPYFVMERLEGCSLGDLLRAEKTLAPERAGTILLQAAWALAAAHAAGVIHRDLKPDNVFLARAKGKETVKLLDFGVAKMAGMGRLTRAGMVYGTPHYMSPEQASGQQVDERTDVYAFGVMLYECFVGHVPFEADSYMGVLTKHMFVAPEPIEKAVPDASSLGALGAIAMRCLAKDKHARFATMNDLASAIQLALLDPPKALLANRGPSVPGMRLRDAEHFDSVVDPLQPLGIRPLVGPLGVGLGVFALCALALFSWHVHASANPGRVVSAPASSLETAAPPMLSAIPLPPALEPERPAKASPPPPAPLAAAAAPSSDAGSPAPSNASPHPSHRVSAPAHSAPKETRHGGDLVDPWAN